MGLNYQTQYNLSLQLIRNLWRVPKKNGLLQFANIIIKFLFNLFVAIVLELIWFVTNVSYYFVYRRKEIIRCVQQQGSNLFLNISYKLCWKFHCGVIKQLIREWLTLFFQTIPQIVSYLMINISFSCIVFKKKWVVFDKRFRDQDEFYK